MKCPNCGETPEGEDCSFKIDLQRTRLIHSVHYYCEHCDTEFVSEGEQIRILDQA